MKMYPLRIIILTLIINELKCQEDPTDAPTTPNKIIVDTTTTLIPKTPETTTGTTTNIYNVIFNTPEVVIAEVNEAFDDLSRTVNETLLNFNEATRTKFDDESGQIFRDLEREELFNLYQDFCTIDQLTAYEEFQTHLNSVSKLWMDKEHSRIDKAFKEVYLKWIEPFRRDVEVHLVTPVTTNLRFTNGHLEKNIACANQYSPQIIKLIETAFTNVLDCYNMTLSYSETAQYADLIQNMYKETAEKFTTCNENIECLEMYCPKVQLLVVKSTSQAIDAMTSIINNFHKEVDQIPKCAEAKFNNAAYIKTKIELRDAIIMCFR